MNCCISYFFNNIINSVLSKAVGTAALSKAVATAKYWAVATAKALCGVDVQEHSQSKQNVYLQMIMQNV